MSRSNKLIKIVEYTPPTERYEAMHYTKKNLKAVLKWFDGAYDLDWYANNWASGEKPLCFGDWLVLKGGNMVRYTEEDFNERFPLVTGDIQ